MKKKFKEWMNAESKSFSIICGERFSHKEVVLMHVYVIGLFIIVGIAGMIGG